MNSVHPLATLVPKAVKPGGSKIASFFERGKRLFLLIISGKPNDSMEPLLLSLYEVSPQCVDVLLSKLEAGAGFDGARSYVKYNFAINDKGYQAMLNPEVSLPSILGIFESENTFLTKKPAIRAMMDAMWNNGVRRYRLH